MPLHGEKKQDGSGVDLRIEYSDELRLLEDPSVKTESSSDSDDSVRPL